MPETTFTFRVDETLKHQFSELAKSEDQSGSQLLRNFMRSYVFNHSEEYDKWYSERVEESIRQLNAGQSVPHETAMKKLYEMRREILDRAGKEKT